MPETNVEKVSSSEEENHHFYCRHIFGLEIFHIKIEEEKRRNKLRWKRAEEDCKIVAEQDSNSSKVSLISLICISILLVIWIFYACVVTGN
ncbi:hypothetical protein MKW92_035699 [Papaver armeniacum]|nr:hypothetical protein MKW92_035699 [Papaver armeniacum]